LVFGAGLALAAVVASTTVVKQFKAWQLPSAAQLLTRKSVQPVAVMAAKD